MSINSSNFSETNQLVEVVRNNIGNNIPVRLLREIHAEEKSDDPDNFTYKGMTYKLIEANIVPRKWEGEGVLG